MKRILLLTIASFCLALLSACVMFPIDANFKPTTWDKTVPSSKNKE